MFTGIVEEIGTITTIEQVNDGWTMTVNASVVLDGVKLGDSIAVNGTCLTVTEFDDNSFKIGMAPETLSRTNLGDLQIGSPVNLERSVPANGRMDGHFVQGHVDGTGVIREFRPDHDSLWVTIETPPDILRYIVTKGYIAVDGTSLTVVDVLDDAFTFMLVAYTQNHIIIPKKSAGDRVNLEADIMGKYIEKFLQARQL
ncbi:MAG: riboflavin synthase [Candidatus Promineifilaceae bacterium]